jgi:hypothetical protein
MKDFTEKHKYIPRPDSHKKVVSDLGKLLCVDGKWSELQVQSTIRTLQAFSATSIDDISGGILPLCSQFDPRECPEYAAALGSRAGHIDFFIPVKKRALNLLAKGANWMSMVPGLQTMGPMDNGYKLRTWMTMFCWIFTPPSRSNLAQVRE